MQASHRSELCYTRPHRLVLVSAGSGGCSRDMSPMGQKLSRDLSVRLLIRVLVNAIFILVAGSKT